MDTQVRQPKTLPTHIKPVKGPYMRHTLPFTTSLKNHHFTCRQPLAKADRANEAINNAAQTTDLFMRWSAPALDAAAHATPQLDVNVMENKPKSRNASDHSHRTPNVAIRSPQLALEPCRSGTTAAAPSRRRKFTSSCHELAPPLVGKQDRKLVQY